MSDSNFPEWQVELDASKLKYPLEYKFILCHKQERKIDCWERNPNRYLADPEIKTNETLVISDRRNCHPRIFPEIRKKFWSR